MQPGWAEATRLRQPVDACRAWGDLPNPVTVGLNGEAGGWVTRGEADATRA